MGDFAILLQTYNRMYYKTGEEFKEVSGYDLERGWYPRVTKILEIKSKPALYKFYGELSSFDEGEIIKEKLSTIHRFIHQLISSNDALLTMASGIPEPSMH
ncbi:MAG: hypothetical protein UY00_C0061G0002 [Candidatus Wolfebacteria bacterium GW2011_GWA1_47_6]|nr:MAG: hypothetical protein UY00_C0061G0002 [Candidatus Wolfebacteria bacterium GW2011_GWA1_47_6]